jgi:hypothetical protein
MACPHFERSAIQLSGEGQVRYAKCHWEAGEDRGNEILVTCHKNGTWILLQCSNLSHLGYYW